MKFEDGKILRHCNCWRLKHICTYDSRNCTGRCDGKEKVISNLLTELSSCKVSAMLICLFHNVLKAVSEWSNSCGEWDHFEEFPFILGKAYDRGKEKRSEACLCMLLQIFRKLSNGNFLETLSRLSHLVPESLGLISKKSQANQLPTGFLIILLSVDC